MNLSTELNSHVILFMDGSKKFITKELFDKLCNIQTESFTVDGVLYRFAQITKIMPLDEFYEQYPDEKPAPTKEFKPLSERKPVRDAKSLMMQSSALKNSGLIKNNQEAKKEKRFYKKCNKELPDHIDNFCSGVCANNL